MRKFLTISLAIAIMAVFHMPLWCALIDIFTWFLLGHGVTGVDWSGLKGPFMMIWTSIIFVPIGCIFAGIIDTLE
jgi:hypothetical protein